MKHAIFLSLLICVASGANAQIEKGNFLIGGTASFQAAKNDDFDSKSWSLSPNVSYFLADRFALGILTPLSTSRNSTAILTTSSVSYAIGPTLRYYFPISSKWAIFPQL